LEVKIVTLKKRKTVLTNWGFRRKDGKGKGGKSGGRMEGSV